MLLSTFLAVALMAAWMSSSVGFIVTRGTLSSTLTSKKGRSMVPVLALLMPPNLFFMAAKLLLVALRIAYRAQECSWAKTAGIQVQFAKQHPPSP